MLPPMHDHVIFVTYLPPYDQEIKWSLAISDTKTMLIFVEIKSFKRQLD